MKNDQIVKDALTINSITGAGEIVRPNDSVQEMFVICDECGDTLWDAVLEQEYPALKFADIIF